MLALLCTAFTAALILLLCAGDPKRRRARRVPGDGHSPALRRLLALVAALPALLCIAAGDPAALLIWLGGSGVAGWAIAAWFNRAGPVRP